MGGWCWMLTAIRSRWSSSWWRTRWCWDARPTRDWPRLAAAGGRPEPGGVREPDEQHAQVRGVPDLREPLEWNATLLEGDLAESVSALKDRHDRTLVAVGAGELTHALTSLGLVDEFWFWVSPSLWPVGAADLRWYWVGPPGADRLDDVRSGVVRLAYRPAADQQSGASG